MLPDTALQCRTAARRRRASPSCRCELPGGGERALGDTGGLLRPRWEHIPSMRPTAFRYPAPMQSFIIAPAGLRPFWLLVPVGIILIGVATLLIFTLMGSRTARFDVLPSGLRLRGDLYGRLIPAAELRASDARRVDWAKDPDLTPRTRTWGTGLPGYQAGWFRLESGEKALLYLTDRQRAVYIPTTRGHAVLLSPADPDAFLKALRAAHATGS